MDINGNLFCFGKLGTLPNAESFCERTLSCANILVTDRNTMFNDEEIEMIVILRMNKKFMEWARKKYA